MKHNYTDAQHSVLFVSFIFIFIFFLTKATVVLSDALSRSKAKKRNLRNQETEASVASGGNLIHKDFSL